MVKIGKTEAGTEKFLIRKTSRGLKGTMENVEHHAILVRPHVKFLSAVVEQIPFKEWRQGHNVHMLVTTDGRAYKLRPIYSYVKNKGRVYIGIALFKLHGLAKLEVPIAQLIDMEDCFDFANLLKLLAKPQHPILRT